MATWGSVKRGGVQGGRRRDRARRYRVVRWFFSILLVIVLLAGVWYVTRLPSFTITSVEVTGTVTIDSQALETRLEHMLDERYIFFIPKRFFYTYPHDALVADILRETRVEEVTVVRVGTELSVAVTEYAPRALWCKEVYSTVNEGCVFISDTGAAFAEAPPLSGSVFRRYAEEGRMPQSGAVFSSSTYMHVTEEFSLALLREHGMQVTAIVKTADGDVRYRVLGDGEIIVAEDTPIQEVFENLDSILSSSEFAHIAPSNFIYIDLRFGDRVFVKEKAVQENLVLDEVSDDEETEEVIATSTDEGVQ